MRVLFFAPFSSIWDITVIEYQLIRKLESFGYELGIVTCGGSFVGLCTSRNIVNLNILNSKKELEYVCEDCKNCAGMVRGKINAKSFVLSDYIDGSELIAENRFHQGTSSKEILENEFLNISVGQLALYELVLKYKKRSLDFNSTQILELNDSCQNIEMTILASHKIISEFKPDISIIYNPQYGVPGAFAEVSISRNVRTLFLSGSSLLNEIKSTVHLWDWKEYKKNPSKIFWDENKLETLKTKDKFRIRNHFRVIKKAISPWVYSNKSQGKSTRDFFGVSKKSKIILATINSQDEIYAAYVRGLIPNSTFQSPVFKSQIEWIKWLINEVSTWEDTKLIVRIHPREYANARESMTAEQNNIWESLVSSHHDHVSFDIPTLNFAISDHFDEIDVLTTGWSSTALEALNYGIPVVTYDHNLPDFPSDIHLTGSSVDEYLANLKKSLTLKRDKERKNKAHHYLWFKHIKGSINLGGTITARSANWPLGLSWVVPRLFHRIPASLRKRLDLKFFISKSDERKLLKFIQSKSNSLYEVD